MLIRKDHLNLIRKLAWSFHHTTGIEYDELFSEASLEYCEAVLKFDSSRETKLSTYAFRRIQIRLVEFCREVRKHTGDSLENVTPVSNPDYEFFYPTISNEVGSVLDIVDNFTLDQDQLPKKYAVGIVRDTLIEQGWSGYKTDNAIKETKHFLNEISFRRII